VLREAAHRLTAPPAREHPRRARNTLVRIEAPSFAPENPLPRRSTCFPPKYPLPRRETLDFAENSLFRAGRACFSRGDPVPGRARLFRQGRASVYAVVSHSEPDPWTTRQIPGSFPVVRRSGASPPAPRRRLGISREIPGHRARSRDDVPWSGDPAHRPRICGVIGGSAPDPWTTRQIRGWHPVVWRSSASSLDLRRDLRIRAGSLDDGPNPQTSSRGQGVQSVVRRSTASSPDLCRIPGRTRQIPGKRPVVRESSASSPDPRRDLGICAGSLDNAPDPGNPARRRLIRGVASLAGPSCAWLRRGKPVRPLDASPRQVAPIRGIAGLFGAS
jgi:hypothetical protein